MPKFDTIEDYYRTYGPFKIGWRCLDCGRSPALTPTPVDWEWDHDRCKKCYDKHKKERLAHWKNKNPYRWRMIQNYYRRQKRKNNPEFKRKEYLRWQKWVMKNPERRRQIALASYHRCKERDKSRK